MEAGISLFPFDCPGAGATAASAVWNGDRVKMPSKYGIVTSAPSLFITGLHDRSKTPAVRRNSAGAARIDGTCRTKCSRHSSMEIWIECSSSLRKESLLIFVTSLT